MPACLQPTLDQRIEAVMSDSTFRDEATLQAGLVRRHEAACRYAIRTYGGAMQHLAASIFGHKIADEVVQEAWFSVMKSVSKFEGRSTLKTWIMRITANEAKVAVTPRETQCRPGGSAGPGRIFRRSF